MYGFGELESVVMDRVWSRADKTTVRQLHEDMVATREIAYTTVMSTMDNLHRKGWLDREKHGKAYHYWPTLSRAEYSAQLMRDALEHGGQPDVVLTLFVGQMTDEENAGLRNVMRRLHSGAAAR